METHKCKTPTKPIFDDADHYFTCPQCKQNWEFRPSNFDGYFYEGKWVKVRPLGQDKDSLLTKITSVFRGKDKMPVITTEAPSLGEVQDTTLLMPEATMVLHKTDITKYDLAECLVSLKCEDASKSISFFGKVMSAESTVDGEFNLAIRDSFNEQVNWTFNLARDNVTVEVAATPEELVAKHT